MKGRQPRKRDDHLRQVQQKPCRDRVVDLLEGRALPALSDYVMRERPAEVDCPWVFLVGSRGKRCCEPLSYDAMVRMFARAAKWAGVRDAWLTLLWQVPSLSLAAQAFLLTIAFGPDTGRTSRLLASGLAVVAALLSLHLLIRHRQAEVTDAHWLAEYEQRHFGITAHGPEWRDRRNATVIPGHLGALARIPAFPLWQAALSLFGVVGLIAFVLAIFNIGSLR